MTVTIQHLTINFDGGAILLGGLLLLIFILLVRKYRQSVLTSHPTGFFITLTFCNLLAIINLYTTYKGVMFGLNIKLRIKALTCWELLFCP